MREGVVVPVDSHFWPVAPVEPGAGRLLKGSVGARLNAHGETLLDTKSGKPMNASRFQPSLLDPADCDAVLCAFYDFSKSFIPTVSAHLWMLDTASGRTQILASCDESSGIFVRQFADNDIVLESLESNTSILRSISRTDLTGKPLHAWRYALPFDSGTIRGVVTLGLESDTPPEIERLEEAIGLYRTIFVAALSLHSAKAKDDSIRILFQGIRKLDTAADSCTILHVALNHAMTLLKAHTGSIMLLDADKQVLRIAAAQGLPSAVSKRTTVAIGEGVSGWVAATGKPLVIEDVDPHGRSNGGRHGVLTALSTPIKDDSGLLGVLNIGRKSLESFQSHQRDYLDMLVSHVAIALRAADDTKFSRQIHVATLKALALTLEMHYPHSVGGKGMVVEWSSRLGIVLGMNSDDLQALEVASVLYDIGIAFTVLAGGSGGPLTTYERGLLMMHPLIAADILEKSRMMQSAIPIVLHHHEHFDGSGYAGKLAGEEIPLGARILAVTDAFGAMTAQRPYRRRMEVSEAVRELRRCSGTKFDPDIVELFVPMIQSESPLC